MVNELVLYIAPPFPKLMFSLKVDEVMSAIPLLSIIELVLMTLPVNSLESMDSFPSFKTIALLRVLSENSLFIMFRVPVLYMIASVSKSLNMQSLNVKVPLFSNDA